MSLFIVVCPHLCSDRNVMHLTLFKIQGTTQCDDTRADVNGKHHSRGGRLRKRKEWERKEKRQGKGGVGEGRRGERKDRNVIVIHTGYGYA